MTDIHHQERHESSPDTIVAEPATLQVTEVSPLDPKEQEQSVVTTAVAAAPAAKPGRLSLAFRSITNGCGLCFHPMRNNTSTDYHTLVVTPTEEEGPILGSDHHDDDHAAAPQPIITQDIKEGHIIHVGSSSSTEHHILEHSTEHHHETKHTTEGSSSAIIEEITVVESNTPSAVTAYVEEVQETVLEREIQPTEVEVLATPPPVPEKDSRPPSIKAASIKAASIESNITTTTTTTVSPTSPLSRGTKRFTKLIKRSSSTNNVPPPATNTSPLLGRFSRLGKKVRPSDSTSNTESKVDSLQVSSEPAFATTSDIKESAHVQSSSVEIAVVDLVDLSPQAVVVATAAETTAVVSEADVTGEQIYQVQIQETGHEEHRHEESKVVLAAVSTEEPVVLETLAGKVESKEVEEELVKVETQVESKKVEEELAQVETRVESKKVEEKLVQVETRVESKKVEEESVQVETRTAEAATRFESTPVRQSSLAVNTSVPVISPILTSEPASIEEGEPLQTWAQSPTLHPNDASAHSSYGHSLIKAGRSSTHGSTVGAGSEAESLGSSEHNMRSNSLDKSVKELKDLDKKRKNSVLKKFSKMVKNTKDKTERRLSRQSTGSGLVSPVSPDEKRTRA